MAAKNKYVTIKNNIDGKPSESDFEIGVSNLTLKVVEGSNDVLVKNLYLSIDPYHVNRMKKRSSAEKEVYFSVPINPGQVIEGNGVCRVLDSDNSEFSKDDIVFAGVLGWEEYSVVRGGSMLRKILSTEFPLSYHANILGISGLTAYGGFYDICKPKKGEKVFVSAASGSVGNLVGQYAKLFGCYVVGCAGTNQKVDLLKDKLGFDDAFNYKEERDIKSTLKRHFPEGIDIYFDNVSGEMFEAAIANMNPFGRVAACGAISEYTNADKQPRINILGVILKRITIQGFLATDLMHLFDDFISTTSDYLRHEKIQALEDISQGIESVPCAFSGLFRGDNIGKKLVRVTGD